MSKYLKYRRLYPKDLTIKDLKEAIKGLEDNELVLLSKNNEGGKYSPLSSYKESYYVNLGLYDDTKHLNQIALVLYPKD